MLFSPSNVVIVNENLHIPANTRKYFFPHILFFLFIILILLIPFNAFSYNPPAGIPDPADVWDGDYDPVEADPPSRPDSWASEQPGFYYIDPSGTDSGRAYGHPGAPRATIPSTLPAGSYVELNGNFNSIPNITCNGAPDNPIWISGLEGKEPILNGFVVKGEHFIVQRVILDTLSGFRFGPQSKYGVFRYSKITGPGTEINSSSSGIGFDGADNDHRNTFLVVYGCEVSKLGLWTSNSNADFHGMKPRYFASYIWILDNAIYNTQGDSIQTGEASGADFPNFIYIGRNTMYDNKENCIDIKDGSDIIISENKCHGMDQAAGDDGGEGVVIHEDADNVWCINNTIHDCSVGLISTSGTNIHFIGNILFNFDGSMDPNSLYGAGVAMHMRATNTGSLVNNTLYNYDKGIQLASGSNFEIHGNIFSNRSDSPAFDVMAASSPRSTSNLGYCLFHGESSPKILWGAAYTDLAGIQANTGQCEGCVSEEDPLFSNATTNDFTIRPESPAIDSAPSHNVYGLFESRYGLSIQRDLNFKSRPYGALWDMGAFEWTTDAFPPEFVSAPRNLSIKNIR